MKVTVNDVLLHAADVLHERGWHQGMLQSPRETNVCVLGAIGLSVAELSEIPCNLARAGHALTQVVFNDDVRHLYQATKERFEQAVDDSAAHWNDWTAQDADDVIHKLKEAAEL